MPPTIQEQLQAIPASRKIFGEMLSQAEGQKQALLSDARKTLAYQFADKMATEAEKALDYLSDQEKILSRG